MQTSSSLEHHPHSVISQRSGATMGPPRWNCRNGIEIFAIQQGNQHPDRRQGKDASSVGMTIVERLPVLEELRLIHKTSSSRHFAAKWSRNGIEIFAIQQDNQHPDRLQG
jgi:hypothetical protein